MSKRQTVFFTAVDPMNKEHRDQNIIDLEAPRLARYHQKNWKKHQNTVHRIERQFAQRKGLKFYLTRLNAIVLYVTHPAHCIWKVVVMKSEEIIFQKVYVSPRPPPKIFYKSIWMCDLDSDVAGSSKDTQRIQPKPKTQLSSTERPVCVPESKERCVLTPEHVEDQTGTGRPVTVDQREEHKIDFRAPGLSHSVVTEAEHLRVQELVKKIENHPHRAALHADLQQSDVYNPFSKNSGKIRELGNVELFELCETIPKVQCVLTAFFIGIKGLCTALADNA